MGAPPQRNRVKAAEAALTVAEAKRDAYRRMVEAILSGLENEVSPATIIALSRATLAELERLA